MEISICRTDQSNKVYFQTIFRRENSGDSVAAKEKSRLESTIREEKFPSPFYPEQILVRSRTETMGADHQIRSVFIHVEFWT